MDIKKIRTDKGLSQLELAKICMVDDSMISHIERGKRMPSVNLAKKIARALDFEWQRFYE